MKIIKEKASAWAWAVVGFIIMLAGTLPFDGIQSIWGSILEPGLTGGAIAGGFRLWRLTVHAKKAAYRSREGGTDFVVCVEVSKPVVAAMKLVFVKKPYCQENREPDFLIKASDIYGKGFLTPVQMKEIAVSVYKAIEPYQHGHRIHLFIQGPQDIGFYIGQAVGFNFNILWYCYDIGHSTYDAGPQLDRGDLM